MNNILEELLEICNRINSTIMSFRVYDTLHECPSAIIEDNKGRLGTIYYEDGVWS